jgi:serine/arginine repetitive matrix protein 2
MYTGEGKPAISISSEPMATDGGAQGPNYDTLPNVEPGRAVEVLELANGETIWFVVLTPKPLAPY